MRNEKIESIYFNNEITIGDKGRDFEIVLFMNPLCSKCKIILKNIPRLFSQFEDNIYLRVLYSGPADDTSKAKLLFADLLESLEEKEDQLKITLIKKYDVRNLQNKDHTKSLLNSLTKQYEWSNYLNLEGTPAMLLNNIILPSFFGIEELCLLLNGVINNDN